MRCTRALPTITVALTVALTLAACGSPSSPSTAGPTESGEPNRGQEITTAYDVQYQPGVAVIDEATASLVAVAGYKLAILGFDLGDGQKELFRKDIEKTQDGTPCDLTGGQH